MEFDRQAALEAAMKLFWQQGYSATSLAQLLDVMGIGRSSFYAAFSDKRCLFVEALALFADRTCGILLEEPGLDPPQAIERFYRYTLLSVPARRTARGCMMVNSILELADVDDELSRLASSHLDRIERLFEELLQRAEVDGAEMALSPRAGARYLMTVNQGLRVAARQGRSRRELAAMLDDALSLLPLAA